MPSFFVCPTPYWINSQTKFQNPFEVLDHDRNDLVVKKVFMLCWKIILPGLFHFIICIWKKPHKIKSNLTRLFFHFLSNPIWIIVTLLFRDFYEICHLVYLFFRQNGSVKDLMYVQTFISVTTYLFNNVNLMKNFKSKKKQG